MTYDIKSPSVFLTDWNPTVEHWEYEVHRWIQIIYKIPVSIIILLKSFSTVSNFGKPEPHIYFCKTMLIKSDLQYMYILHVDRGKINDFVYMYGTFKVRIAYKYQIHVHLIRTSGRYRVIYLRGCMPSISQIPLPCLMRWRLTVFLFFRLPPALLRAVYLSPPAGT